MDPYYQGQVNVGGQQAQGQPQPQQLQGQAPLVGPGPASQMSSGVGMAPSREMAAQMQVPSAPSMQMSGGGGPQTGVMMHAGQQQQQHQMMAGGQQPVSHRSQHHQQQQAPAGAYLDGQAQMGHHSGRPNGSSSHHHGGQAPPLPGGHHSSSSGRYTSSGGHHGSHRSAAMHQHRSSAAAISDPMMASGITDHLASASGPMTGSGGALNQLGGAPGQSYYHQSDPRYAQQPVGSDTSYLSAGGYPNVQSAGPSHHQSRYDSHYSSRPSRHHTTSGAYHLDRTAMDGLDRPSSYYPASGGGPSMHQSLGNLPSATSNSARFLDQQAHHLRGYGDQLGYPADRYDGRAGSMPPPDTTGVGLGSYNPLDDPLANHAVHLRNPTAGLGGQLMDPAASGYHHAGHQPAYGQQQAQQAGGGRDSYVIELRARLQELQNSYAAVKRELETATQKLGSSMHSIKSFWSPELKKERALRKEEATKYALINDQMKLMRLEVQVSFLVLPLPLLLLLLLLFSPQQVLVLFALGVGATANMLMS